MASDQSGDLGPPFCDFTGYALTMLFPAQNDSLRCPLCHLNADVSGEPRISLFFWGGGLYKCNYRFVFGGLPEPNRACLVGVCAVTLDPTFPYME